MLKNSPGVDVCAVAAVSEGVKELVKPPHPAFGHPLPEGEGSWHVEQTKALSLLERVPRQRRVRAGTQFIHTFRERATADRIPHVYEFSVT